MSLRVMWVLSIFSSQCGTASLYHLRNMQIDRRPIPSLRCTCSSENRVVVFIIFGWILILFDEYSYHDPLHVHALETTCHSIYKQIRLDSCLCIFWKYGPLLWIQLYTRLVRFSWKSAYSGMTLSDSTQHYMPVHAHVGCRYLFRYLILSGIWNYKTTIL